MEAILKKWGNSLAVHIPAGMLRTAGLAEGDRVSISETDGVITIRKENRVKHRSLEQRVMDAYGVSIDQVTQEQTREIDWGEPAGEEIW